MRRRSLFTLMIIASCLTFVMALYTVASLCFMGQRTTNVAVALVDGDKFVCEEGTTTIDGDKEALQFNKDDGSYLAINADDNKVDTVKKVTISVRNIWGKKYVYSIKIYRVGNGTVQDPYNINNGDLLRQRVSEKNAETKSFNLVCDIDLGEKEWKPFGNVQNKYIGTFNGNGYAISNMKINVTNDNLKDFVVTDVEDETDKHIDIGFFGFASEANVKNVGLKDYEISIAKDLIVVEGLNNFYVGGLVAESWKSVVVGIEDKNEISGKITESSIGYVGGIVGKTILSRVENFDVKVSIVSQNTGAKIGAVVGNAKALTDAEKNAEGENLADSCIKNINVSADVEVDFGGEKASCICGVTVQAIGTVIENITINNFDVKLSAGAKSLDSKSYNKAVCGVTYYAKNREYLDGTISKTVIKNVNVKEMNSNIDSTVAAGIIYRLEIDAEMIDCVVAGDVTLGGGIAAGVAIDNSGTIYYTTNFVADEVVKANILGCSHAAGFVYCNNGKIVNYNTVSKQKVNVQVSWTGNKYFGTVISSADEEFFNVIADTAYVAGFATKMYGDGEIDGFEVNVVLENGVNMAGLVGELGVDKFCETTEDGYALKFVADNDSLIDENKLTGGKISNCVVNVNKVSTVGYTKRVAGAVAEVGNDTTIENVVAKLIIKKDDANATSGSCAAIVGGLVAQISGNDSTISNCKVENSNITVNDTSLIFKANSGDVYKWNIVGGLVGTIRSYDEANNHEANNITITSCDVVNSVISNFVLFVENDKVYKLIENGATNGVGGLIGVVQSLTSTVNGCKVENVVIAVSEQIVTKNVANLKIAVSSLEDYKNGVDASATSNVIRTGSAA